MLYSNKASLSARVKLQWHLQCRTHSFNFRYVLLQKHPTDTHWFLKHQKQIGNVINIIEITIVISGRERMHACIWAMAPCVHDDVIKWKHFPRYWPFVRGIQRLPVNSLHKGNMLLNKRLNKQSWGWWFEPPSCSLWHHYNLLTKNARSLLLIAWAAKMCSTFKSHDQEVKVHHRNYETCEFA